MAKCPFKKTTHIRSYEHEETFGYCQSDCMAGFLREDGTFGCVFIERYKPLVIEGEDFYEEQYIKKHFKKGVMHFNRSYGGKLCRA